MKKFYRIFLLLILLITLTTFTPSELNTFPKKKNFLFKIKNVEIIENQIINKQEIKEKLTDVYGKNIFFVKKNDLEKSLKSIEFLEKIEVKKKYPDTIIIQIYETKPLGIFFKKNQKYLLDSSSKLIDFNKYDFFDNLPSIFGDGAEKNFVIFFKQLQNNNFPIKRINKYYYFQIGRWDIRLVNDQIIKFPPNKMAEAIQKSVELINHQDFENQNIIDLRIHGKIVVE